MSRVGKKPIPLPSGVEVTLDGQSVRVRGPQGELTHEVHPAMRVAQEDGALRVLEVNTLPGMTDRSITAWMA